jgi:Cd2+/Zn2+-exporting ATPase
MIERLHTLGVSRVVMLTGARRLRRLPPPSGWTRSHAAMMPDHKLERIRAIRAQGLRVAMGRRHQ